MLLTDRQAMDRLKYWLGYFKLDPFYQWRVKINNHPDKTEAKKWRKCAAFINVDSSYGYIELVINPYNFEPNELDAVLVHEIGHVLLTEIQEWGLMHSLPAFRDNVMRMIESANERFARVIVAAHGKSAKRKGKSK